MARWGRLNTRGNVEDRRGMSPRAATIGGIGGVGLVVFLLISFLGGGGGEFGQVLDQLAQPQTGAPSGPQPEEFQGSDDYEVFVSTVLGSTDEMWDAIFAANDLVYVEPTLVLFRGSTTSQCGGAHSAVGPHYCPPDETIYLDETFFDELQRRFGAQGGDVAEAYVIAHEVGHHVQNRLGIMADVRNAQSGVSSEEANALSVSMELQADCFAGVWANSIRDAGVFLPNEIEEAIDAAAAVGDDRIQETMQGQVRPENWTHGSSAQRVEWFTRGFESGDPSVCDTF